MTTERLRRTRHRINPVDITHFTPVVNQAMHAFQADVSYAVHMARAATAIVRKRQVWQARKEAGTA